MIPKSVQRFAEKIMLCARTMKESPVTRARNFEDSAAAQPGDPNRILASIGLVPYDWRIDTDAIAWGANALEVLQVYDLNVIGSGRAYAELLGPENTTSRYDAV